MASDEKNRGHEPSDVNVKGVAAVGGVILAGVLLTLVGVWVAAYLGGFKEFTRFGYGYSVEPQPADVPQNQSKGPRLDTQGLQSLDRLKAAQLARLSGYGWVDRDAGIAHIPIARAMELAPGQGLFPVRSMPEMEGL